MKIDTSTETLQLISADQAWHYQVIPKLFQEDRIEFFTYESHEIEIKKEELELIFSKEVSFVLIDEADFRIELSKHYRKKKDLSNSKKIDFHSNDFLMALVSEANSLDCSDIHFETYDEKCRVRFRIDGKLMERYVLQKSEYKYVINQIKILANIDIAEKRLPQDGRIFFKDEQKRFDIRVSIIPSLFGEKAVLRLLSKDTTDIDIRKIGFNEEQLKVYLSSIKKPFGIILISGSTGSGKTTTLYATLKILNKEDSNIVTIEDPVEYTLEGINQVQLKEDIGLTFPSAIRSFLRQDPDIIMLGEIRDKETAQMAIRASLTGHLVLSTIHTNSAWGAISRLIDMGIPSFLIANTLILSIAQRLVRLLCTHCKQKEIFSKELVQGNYASYFTNDFHYVATGCEHCHFTGYSGRIGIFEVIEISGPLKAKIIQTDSNEDEFLEFRNSLAHSSIELFKKGETSFEEVLKYLIL
ncbi:MAG: GspE/PulE family protein [Bacteroidales bacterium]|nr:GspE/PulE family protein [Bacteroidales bacterium]